MPFSYAHMFILSISVTPDGKLCLLHFHPIFFSKAEYMDFSLILLSQEPCGVGTAEGVPSPVNFMAEQGLNLDFPSPPVT